MLRLILFILLMAGVVLLEMYLSRKPSRWPGLVLPGVTVLYSLLMVLAIVSFLISLIYPLSITNLGDMAAAIAQAVIVWVLANIPTAVLLAIYFAARRRVRRTREQNRMSAQDL